MPKWLRETLHACLVGALAALAFALAIGVWAVFENEPPPPPPIIYDEPQGSSQ